MYSTDGFHREECVKDPHEESITVKVELVFEHVWLRVLLVYCSNTAPIRRDSTLSEGTIRG
jgi:hypothetical protein